MICTIEELSLNALPALQTMHVGGWVLRFANGYTKRANSINPIYDSTSIVEEKIRFCVQLYLRTDKTSWSESPPRHRGHLKLFVPPEHRSHNAFRNIRTSWS